VPVLHDLEDQMRQQAPLQYSSLGNLDTLTICGLPVKWKNTIIKDYNVKKSKVYILNLILNPIAFVAVFVFHMFRLREVVQFEA
jgi:hypothetical protein